jgi:hypothetical protein
MAISPRGDGAPGQRHALGRLWQGLAVAVCVGLILAAGSYTGSSPEMARGLLLGIAVAGFAMIGWLWKRGKRHLAPGAAQALARDPRPPVLYLRSFAGERAISGEEEALARIMEELGPFVAIGQPGERLPPLGASRFYVPGSDWQTFVVDLLGSSRLVLLAAGGTQGLGWELSQCVKLIEPRNLLVLVPASSTAYEAFRSIAAREADLVLPALAASARLGGDTTGFQGVLHFDENWAASFVSFDRPVAGFAATDQREDRLRAALTPALAPIGLQIGPRPENLRDEARTALNIVLVIAVIAMVAGLAFAILWALGGAAGR